MNYSNNIILYVHITVSIMTNTFYLNIKNQENKFLLHKFKVELYTSLINSSKKSSFQIVKVTIFQKLHNAVQSKVLQEKQHISRLFWHQICKNGIKIREFWLQEQSQVHFDRLQNQTYYCTNFMLIWDNCVQ